jgi:hypothetical protein
LKYNQNLQQIIQFILQYPKKKKLCDEDVNVERKGFTRLV